MNTKTGIRFLIITRDKAVREFDVILPIAPAGIVGSDIVGNYVIGNTGPVGSRGRAGTITIGKVTPSDTDGDAQVTNVADDDIDVKLNFVLPRGRDGKQGDKGDITQVLIHDIDPEQEDAVESIIWLNNHSGDENAAKLDFVLPKGEKGERGSIWLIKEANPVLGPEYKLFDCFLNSVTKELFIFTGSHWQSSGFLKGEKGDSGARWYSGTTVPDVSIGLNDKRGKPRPGDMYLHINNDDHDVSSYILTDDKSWEGLIATIGVVGSPGEDGAAGKDVLLSNFQKVQVLLLKEMSI